MLVKVGASISSILIGEEIRSQLEASGSVYSILSSPLLLETSHKDLCGVALFIVQRGDERRKYLLEGCSTQK